MGWVLIAADGSEGSATAVRLAKSIAWPADTVISVLSVVQPIAELIGMTYVPVVPLYSKEAEEAERRRAQEVTWSAVDELRSAGHAAHCLVKRGRPADVIVEHAKRYGADLIIMGSRGLGTFEAVLLGSVSAEVVDRAPCPVLIARTDRLGATLIADDGSPQAAAARAYLAQRPYLLGAPVRLVGVVPQPMFWPDSLMPLDAGSVETIVDANESVQSALADILKANASGIAATGVPVTSEIREGHAAHELLAAADDCGADLIVVGSHGRRGLRRAVLGSVSRGVMHHARSSVLVVPQGHAGERAGAAEAPAA